jgi:hypothetical protein
LVYSWHLLTGGWQSSFVVDTQQRCYEFARLVEDPPLLADVLPQDAFDEDLQVFVCLKRQFSDGHIEFWNDVDNRLQLWLHKHTPCLCSLHVSHLSLSHPFIYMYSLPPVRNTDNCIQRWNV